MHPPITTLQQSTCPLLLLYIADLSAGGVQFSVLVNFVAVFHDVIAVEIRVFIVVVIVVVDDDVG